MILVCHRSVVAVVAIEDYAKDDGEYFLPRRIAVELQIFKDSIGIRLKNEVHLGTRFLVTIVCAIVCYADVVAKFWIRSSDRY